MLRFWPRAASRLPAGSWKIFPVLPRMSISSFPFLASFGKTWTKFFPSMFPAGKNWMSRRAYHVYFAIFGNPCIRWHPAGPVSGFCLYPVSPVSVGRGCAPVALVLPLVVDFSRLFFSDGFFCSFFVLYKPYTGLSFCPYTFTRQSFSTLLGPFSGPYGCLQFFPSSAFPFAATVRMENFDCQNMALAGVGKNIL